MTTTAAALAAVSLAAACGGSGDDAGGGSGDATVNVTMGAPDEYAMVPDPAEIGSGSVTFAVSNQGAEDHEMVVVRTKKGAANLGSAEGEADETGAVDEIVLKAGESGDLAVDLEPGKYALVCNLPGHYAEGMYADFTVR